MRNTSGQQGKNDRQGKKVAKNMYDINTCNRRKFLDVSLCSQAKQQQRKESVLHVQSCCCCCFLIAN